MLILFALFFVLSEAKDLHGAIADFPQEKNRSLQGDPSHRPRSGHRPSLLGVGSVDSALDDSNKSADA